MILFKLLLGRYASLLITQWWPRTLHEQWQWRLRKVCLCVICVMHVIQCMKSDGYMPANLHPLSHSWTLHIPAPRTKVSRWGGRRQGRNPAQAPLAKSRTAYSVSPHKCCFPIIGPPGRAPVSNSHKGAVCGSLSLVPFPTQHNSIESVCL